ncbi:MAG TPA: HupE/UreJ family protein [Pseudomonadales bacterium]|nr:HupE/UreJ family protein [Pseudomonadales bacterium]
MRAATGRGWRALALLLLITLQAGGAQAHLLNMTEATVRVAPDGGVDVDLRIDLTREFGDTRGYHAFANRPPSELMAPPLMARWERLLDAVELRQGETRVALHLTAVEAPAERSLAAFEDPFVWPRTRLRFAGRLAGTAPLRVTFASRFRFEEPIAVSLVDTASGASRSRWLVANQTSPALVLDGMAPQAEAPAEPLWRRILAYAGVGFAHILPTGTDHLLFVLMLLLASARRRDLLLQVSLFTLAHSLTLIMAAYRIIELPARPVEVLIAASILWVAIENLRGGAVGGTRLAVVFAFGLLHGLGFARALAALELPTRDFLLALVSFNVGVEAGQLAFIALVLVVLAVVGTRLDRDRQLRKPLSLATALVALYWIVARL